MKKLLVLALVMGIASLATAGYTLAYDNGQVVVGTDADLVGGINVMLGASGGTLVATNDDITPATLRTVGAPVAAPEWLLVVDGTTALSYEIPYDGGAVVMSWGDPVTTPAPAGFWFSWAMPGYVVDPTGTSSIVVELTDNIEGTVQAIHLIPEPATMALLGLGALVLRRKK